MQMAEFVLVYSFGKTIRALLAGTILMAVAWCVCQIGKYRTKWLNLVLLCLVPLGCFTGYSKIFYTKQVFWITSFVDQLQRMDLAVGYFSIAALLGLRFLYTQYGMRCNLKRMQPYEGVQASCIRCTGTKSSRIRFTARIRVYVSSDGQGPYAGGILHPYIVVPQALESLLSEEEFKAILYHEALHIRLGHLVMLNIYALLKIIWWIHPFIYLCDAKLRENMEYSSDEGSMAYSRLDAYAYGNVILKALQAKRRFPLIQEGITAFSGNGFAVIKRRLRGIALADGQAGLHAEISYVSKKRRFHQMIAVAVLLGIVLITATSYPRYTVNTKIAAFDEELHVLTYDLEMEGIHADIADGSFHMQETELQKLTKRYALNGEYVFFSYDVIQKIPGVGGGGQCVMVSLNHPGDVWLLVKEGFINKLQIFVLKYLL